MEAVALEVNRFLVGPLQERLIFRFQTFIRAEISSFVASPAALASVKSEPPCADGVKSVAPSPPDSVGARWYRPVQRALMALAQVYRCLPRSVFEGLAQVTP